MNSLTLIIFIDIVVSLARMLGYCNVLKLWKANWFEASLIFV